MSVVSQTSEVILVADDNPDALFMVQSMLDLLGFAAECVENGRIACERAMTQRYRCILMDIEMPEMDGLAAARTIRDAEQAEGGICTPILGMTGHTDTGTRVLCERAGMSGVLLKPFLISNLEETLAKIG